MNRLAQCSRAEAASWLDHLEACDRDRAVDPASGAYVRQQWARLYHLDAHESSDQPLQSEAQLRARAQGQIPLADLMGADNPHLDWFSSLHG